MTSPRRRRAGALAVALAIGATPALAGCGSEVNLRPTTLIGRSASATTVLVAAGAENAVAGALTRYAGTRESGFLYGTGSPDDIATTVKNGRLIDMVVLPAGPGLDRVEDELLKPASRFGRVGSTTYYLGAVTSKALAFITWLSSRPGQVALRANGVR